MSAHRSHPPSLLKLAARSIADHALLPRGALVLVACSGGPDSTALLHVLTRLRQRFGHDIVAHGVDHGLRAEAAAELALAAELAARLHVPFAVTRVEVAGGANLQARARAARWGALQAAAASAGATLIATGHTADDRAETVLIRLLRGAGPRGLAVLAPRSTPQAGPTRLRPLIAARRRDVLAHLERHAIGFASDPSNRDLRFVRARIRHEILPALEALSPELVPHLCALSDMLAELIPSDDPLAELGRAQRLAIGRAQRLGRAKLTLRGEAGQRLDVTFPRGRPMVTKDG